MIWHSVLIFITALSLHGLLPSGNSAFQGRVITESGEPIKDAGVLFVSKGAPEIAVGYYVATDETGTFHLKRVPEAIFVKKEGYFPQLYRLTSRDQRPLVVMHHVDGVSQAAPPTCSDVGSNENFLRIDNGFRLTVSRELTVESTDNPKAPYAALAYRKDPQQRMTISWGNGGILGFPEIAVLANTPEIVVRGEADISGSTTEGKHWRWMSERGGHIEYKDVSAEAADLFDHQLDSLCHIDEGSKPH
jgi:hypothetical protein